MPVDLQDAMKKATSLDTFMNMLNASDITNEEQEEHVGEYNQSKRYFVLWLSVWSYWKVMFGNGIWKFVIFIS